MAGAYRVIDRRGSSNGRQSLPVFQTNNLYPAATPNSDRRSVPSLDYDGYNLVTPQGRRNLMTASNYQMHFHTSDNEWNNAAEELVTRETIEGGTIEYYKSSANVRLESVKDDRPSTNGMEFDRTVTRDALAGIGWSYDYAIDPTKAGGAQMRVVVEKINRTILHIQRTLIEPCRKQLDNWRINVFMQRGDLPYNEEWFKYRYQVPAKLTADAKYQSQVDITEYAAGFTTHERIAANRSSNWEDDQDQKAREIKRAMNLAESMGIPVAYLLSGVANTNVLTQSLNSDAEQTPQNSD
jgi:hypothetical protein